jgi:hypothetical protein
MFRNFIKVKSNKIVNNEITIHTRETTTYLESLEFYKILDVNLTKFKEK